MSATFDLPPIVITSGEPAGIGPDLCVTLAQSCRTLPLVIIGDGDLLSERARQLDLPLSLSPYQHGLSAATAPATLTLLHQPLATPAVAGKLDSRNAHYLLDTIKRAVQGALSGEFRAVVTAPIHKGIINDAGVPFSGHTELLAELTGSEDVVMMLATHSLRVALATTHLPLCEVSAAITTERLERLIILLHDDLRRRFCIDQPRIVVCGLNPHAGEGGHLGSEEVEVISPLLERLREEGLDLIGPLPADSAFLPKRLQECDVVLAMYHDQGLPLLKHLGFGRAVNITLGLPIVRTSVDHGTAIELAGSGRAEVGSLKYAIEVADEMSRHL